MNFPERAKVLYHSVLAVRPRDLGYEPSIVSMIFVMIDDTLVQRSPLADDHGRDGATKLPAPDLLC